MLGSRHEPVALTVGMVQALTMEPSRRQLLMVIVVALVALVLWTVFRVGGDRGEEARDLAALDGRGGEQGTSAEGAERARRDRSAAAGELSLVVRDMDGEAVAGLELGVGPASGTTDHLGELTLRRMEPGLYGVRVPEGWLLHHFENDTPREIEVTVGSQREKLYVVRDCTGPFEVHWPSGEPMVGARLITGLGEAIVDARGLTPPVARHCGVNELWFWHEKGFAYINVPVEVAGPELVVVPLPSDQGAELFVVDVEGQPVDAEVSGIHLAESTRIGPGLVRVTAPVDVLNCSVSAPGLALQTVHVPLDGGRYTVELGGVREVTVHASCDGACPEKLSCGREPCEPLGARFTCLCRDEDATITAQGMPCSTIGPTLAVPEGVTDIDWDLRCGGGSVVGRWGGRTPCSVSISGHGYKLGRCSADGRFEVSELWPGSYTVVVTDQDRSRGSRANASQQASRQLELREGQRLDLGSLRPDSGCIEGVLDSDESLDDVVVDVPSMHVNAGLANDGGFMLCGLPLDEDVTLEVRSFNLGWATTTAKAGDFLTWRVSWGLDGGETVSVRREAAK